MKVSKYAFDMSDQKILAVHEEIAPFPSSALRDVSHGVLRNNGMMASMERNVDDAVDSVFPAVPIVADDSINSQVHGGNNRWCFLY